MTEQTQKVQKAQNKICVDDAAASVVYEDINDCPDSQMNDTSLEMSNSMLNERETPLAQRTYVLSSTAEIKSDTGKTVPRQMQKVSSEYQCSISEHSLQSNSKAEHVGLSENKTKSLNQSSQILSERTLNLKFQITKLDDEIVQLQQNLQHALNRRL